MRIALIDDDNSHLMQLQEFISEELLSFGGNTHKIDTFCSGENFLSCWQTDKYDLIILDIYMEELTGIETARKIRETDDTVQLAFCTSSNEFASESYEVNARYYLQKPVTKSGIVQMFQRLNLETLELNRAITLPDGHPVHLRSILYTEYSNHTITVYMKDNSTYKFRFSQKEMEELLLPFGYFCNPNKGLIINFYEVTRLNEEMLVLSNQKQFPISRRKSKDIKDAYTKFCFKNMQKEIDR